MPRWPAGLHRAGGSGVAYGGSPRRLVVTPQAQYWRRTATALHAGANAVFTAHGQPGPIFSWQATVGPQGAGEQWAVDIVQVQFPSQYGQPPLVIAQIQGQISGSTTTQPPPFVAQAWLSIGGTKDKLLAQTTQGGNDALSVECPLLSAGEAIAVVFYGPLANGFPWMALRGTRFAMSPV